VSSALECNKEQLEAQQRIAEAQAEAAEAQANAALMAAQSEQQAQLQLAEQRTAQVKTVAWVGGGLLLLLATGYAIVKV
jgi:hypothetical protein